MAIIGQFHPIVNRSICHNYSGVMRWADWKNYEKASGWPKCRCRCWQGSTRAIIPKSRVESGIILSNNVSGSPKHWIPVWTILRGWRMRRNPIQEKAKNKRKVGTIVPTFAFSAYGHWIRCCRIMRIHRSLPGAFLSCSVKKGSKETAGNFP